MNHIDVLISHDAHRYSIEIASTNSNSTTNNVCTRRLVPVTADTALISK